MRRQGKEWPTTFWVKFTPLRNVNSKRRLAVSFLQFCKHQAYNEMCCSIQWNCPTCTQYARVTLCVLLLLLQCMHVISSTFRVRVIFGIVVSGIEEICTRASVSF